MGAKCEHGQLARLCRMCEQNFEIDRLRARLDMVSDAQYLLREELSQARAGSLPDLQREIGGWGNATFPHSTPASIIEHFKRESRELYLSYNTACGPTEAADCAILLLHYAHRMGFDLLSEIRSKFEINKARTWGEPDEDGVVEHVRTIVQHQITTDNTQHTTH